MDTSFLILALSLGCPTSLFLGAVGAIVALRSLGARWPWEQSVPEQSCQWRQKIVDRVPAEDAPEIVQDEIDDGWRFVASEQVMPGVMQLRFVKGR